MFLASLIKDAVATHNDFYISSYDLFIKHHNFNDLTDNLNFVLFNTNNCIAGFRDFQLQAMAEATQAATT